ncbi:MAG: PBSX family phage terminase large subunit [bacterium]|nr:PBSX family phage terminase large subunit [bacterium]MDY5456988.1 PBSX family phage terminase large subunit [Bariatricus sp.]
MAEINLKLKKNLFVPKFYSLLFDYSHRWEVYMGSAGSAKSYFITQKLILRCLNEKIKILVCRRTASTIRNTCFSLFKDVLSKWKLTEFVKIRESDFNIKFPNSSEIIFMGLDEETKLLSLNAIGTIFIEEAYEVPKPIVEQLNLRLRGNTANKQMIMAFNPISKNHWLYDFCEVNPPESFAYIHSTYKDNPFLDDEYVHELEELYVRNPAKARVFCDGIWGIDAEGLVIQNWKEEIFDPMELSSQGLEHRVGMDLGWIDKSAIIETLYDRQNKTIYVFNEFYKSGCQLSELADAIRNMNLQKSKIYVDAAEPRSIQYFKNEGINAVGCAKGKDSVKAGLMFLQDNLIIVHPRCIHFIAELENFSYIKSKQTGEWTENTTHEWSHAIDACRYGYSDIYTNKKLRTLDKSLLGL